MDEVEARCLTGDPPDPEGAYRGGQLARSALGDGHEPVQVRIADGPGPCGTLPLPADLRLASADQPLQAPSQLVGRRRRARLGKGREGRDGDRRALGQPGQDALTTAQLVGERRQVGALGAEAGQGLPSPVGAKEAGDRLVGPGERSRPERGEQSPAADVGRRGPDVVERPGRGAADLLRPVDAERGQDEDRVRDGGQRLTSGTGQGEPVLDSGGR